MPINWTPVLLFVSGTLLVYSWLERKWKSKQAQISPDILSTIGGTPMVELKTLSQLTGCRILAKLEFLNPGGSVKDRVALSIVEGAEARGELRPGGTIVEATAGSTGVALAMVAKAKGYQLHLYIPDNVSKEKVHLLTALGAHLHIVPIVPLSDPLHFMHRAKRHCTENSNCFYANQFDNIDNFEAHYRTTGPEIWQQTQGQVDAIVLGSGTGGTIAGLSSFLRTQKAVSVYLADPEGSGLGGLVNRGVMFDPKDRLIVQPLQARTIFEGIGLNRQTPNFGYFSFLFAYPEKTDNFQRAHIDHAFSITDTEGVLMTKWLLEKEGLFVGGSSGVNCVGAVRAAARLGPGHVIVTLLCDSGQRYLSSIFNEDSLVARGIPVESPSDLGFLGF